MEQEDTIDYNIRKTWYNIAKIYNKTASEYMSSMSMGMVLLNIDVVEGTQSTQLGPIMGMESTSLSRTLNRLEELGVIDFISAFQFVSSFMILGKKAPRSFTSNVNLFSLIVAPRAVTMGISFSGVDFNSIVTPDFPNVLISFLGEPSFNTNPLSIIETFSHKNSASSI